MVRYLGLSLLMSAAVVGSEDQSCRLPPPNMLTPLEIAAALKIPGWRSVPPPPPTHTLPPSCAPFIPWMARRASPSWRPAPRFTAPGHPHIPASPPPRPQHQSYLAHPCGKALLGVHRLRTQPLAWWIRVWQPSHQSAVRCTAASAAEDRSPGGSCRQHYSFAGRFSPVRNICVCPLIRVLPTAFIPPAVCSS